MDMDKVKPVYKYVPVRMHGGAVHTGAQLRGGR